MLDAVRPVKVNVKVKVEVSVKVNVNVIVGLMPSGQLALRLTLTLPKSTPCR